jgi:hypothetical protein
LRLEDVSWLGLFKVLRLDVNIGDFLLEKPSCAAPRVFSIWRGFALIVAFSFCYVSTYCTPSSFGALKVFFLKLGLFSLR